MGPGEAAELLDRALALWQGRAYAEFADDDFARAEAVRLEELRVAAAEDRVDADLALGRTAEATARAERLVAEHPLRDRPHAQLMLAHYRAGRAPDALEVYRRYRDRLDEELGVAPAPAVQQLHGQILRQDPELDLPPPATDPAYTGAAGNLPAHRTVLVGRERDAEGLLATLHRARVVTVVGVGGVGKTALALHAARAAAAEFADGAWLVELAAVRDPAAVVDAIGTTLAVRQRAGLDGTERLVEFLHPKRLLLVLDNCEHLVEAAAEAVEAITGGCPGVTVLATSREPLGVTGEHLHPLAPLAVPAATTAEPDTLARVPSVHLLLERATAAAPGFTLDRTNAAAVVEICRRLDGLPLAIELAAPKLRTMGAAEVAARLDARFPLLRSGRRIADARQRTLHGVVDWSYRLLDPDQRRVFERLAVFAGSFPLAAAERVCGALGADPADVAEIVLGLVDRSLVVAHLGGTDGTRYALLETIRAFARDRLAEHGELDPALRAHAEWAVEFAEAAEPGLQGPDEARWVRVLSAATDDLRAAHAWALEHDLGLAVRLVAPLYWYAEYHVAEEMRAWAGSTVRATERAGCTHPRLPGAYAVAAIAHRLRGDLATTRIIAERGAGLAADPADPAGLSLRTVLVDVEFFEGRLAEADALLVDLERDTRAASAHFLLTITLWMRALTACYRGDREAALHHVAQAKREARALGNPSMTAWVAYTEAEIRLDTEPGRAIRLLDEAIALARGIDNRYLVGVALVSAASVQGRHGDPHRALRRFRAVIAHWHEAGGWNHLWTAMRSVVDLLARVGADEDAAVLYGAISASRTATRAYGADAARLAAVLDALTRRLGPERLERAVRRGAEMGDDAAVAAAYAAIDAAAPDASRLDQAGPDRVAGEVEPVAHAELLEDVGAVPVDGLHADPERLGDLP